MVLVKVTTAANQTQATRKKPSQAFSRVVRVELSMQIFRSRVSSSGIVQLVADYNCGGNGEDEQCQ